MPVEIHDPRRPPRPLLEALKRGLRGRCPACGDGRIFGRYLKVNDACPNCAEALHHHRADDAPPYFTILIVGHLIASLVLTVEMTWHPPLWLQMIVWGPLTIVAALAFLQPIKGAVVAQQWALYMHGFDPDHVEELDQPDDFAGDPS